MSTCVSTGALPPECRGLRIVLVLQRGGWNRVGDPKQGVIVRPPPDLDHISQYSPLYGGVQSEGRVEPQMKGYQEKGIQTPHGVRPV